MRSAWLFFTLLPFVPGIRADGSLYPPGLMPLINHANSLLSTGKFGDAATAYSQAIGEHEREPQLLAAYPSHRTISDRLCVVLQTGYCILFSQQAPERSPRLREGPRAYF